MVSRYLCVDVRSVGVLHWKGINLVHAIIGKIKGEIEGRALGGESLPPTPTPHNLFPPCLAEGVLLAPTAPRRRCFSLGWTVKGVV